MKLGSSHPTKTHLAAFGSQPTLHSSSSEGSWEDDLDFATCVEGDIEVCSKPTGQVYFVRHGESTANEANVYSGVTDVKLTRFGVRQAQAAGADMEQKGIHHLDAVYTSHLVRTRKTAAVALLTAGLVPNDDLEGTDFWPEHLQPIPMPCLAERSFGIFTGENKVLLRRAIGHENFERMVHSPDDAPPCAETIGSIYRRCEAFHRSEILPRLRRGETSLVVAHQYVLEAYALVLEGLPPDEYYSFSLPNGKTLSADDMKRYRCHSTSEWQKYIDVFGDKTILHGTKIAAVTFVVGAIFRALPSLWGTPVVHQAFGLVFQIVITCCLATSSWFAYLEIDLSNSLAHTPLLESQLVASTYVLRIGLAAILGLVLVQDTDIDQNLKESLEWWLVLFAVPPALTTPTISLTWGGKVYLTAVWSSVLNVVCGLVLLGLALSPFLEMDAVSLIPFGTIFVAALLLPACAAQLYRKIRPVESKKYSKKWKFLGVVAFDIMGLAAGFHFTPGNIFGEGLTDNCIAQFQIAVLVYLVMRLTAATVARIAMRGRREISNRFFLNVDVYILLSQHNIFLWTALASGVQSNLYETSSATVYTLFWASAFFFLVPALEEKVFVNILAKRLLRTALSRTELKAKAGELNKIWKDLTSKFVKESEVVDFYQE